MTKVQKGLLWLVIVITAVIALSYAGIRYIEGSVADVIRNWAVNTPAEYKLKIADIQYNLQKNILILRNVSFSYPVNGVPADTAIDQIEIRKPDSAFLSLLSDPQHKIDDADFPVAEEILCTNIVSGPTTRVHFADSAVYGLSMDTEKTKALLTKKFPFYSVLLSTLFAYKSTSIQKMTLAGTLEEGEPFTISAGSIETSGYSYGHTDWVVISPLSFTEENGGSITIERLLMENMNTPSEDVLRELQTLDPNAPPQVALDALARLFDSEDPLIGLFEMNGVTCNAKDEPAVSFKTFRYNEPQAKPFTFDILLEQLETPLNITSELETLKLLGLKTFNTTLTFSWASPAKAGDQLQSSASLGVAGLGTVDLSFTALAPQFALPQGVTFEDKEGLAAYIQEYLLGMLKISQIEAGYADEGLLPRLAAMYKSLLQLSPEAVQAQLQTLFHEEMQDFSFIPDLQSKTDQFISHPGAMRMRFRSVPPQTINALAETTTAPADFFSLDVTPGPKPLVDLMGELK